LRNLVSLSPIGEEVNLRVLRDGREKTIGVILDELPAEAMLASTGERIGNEDDGGIEGVKVQSLTPQRRRLTEVPDDIDGVIVVDVDRRSNASREGLVAGDVIVEVNKKKVEDVADYSRLVSKDDDKPILLRVYKPQGGGLLFMAIPR
jgi:S1-C subfamily serine protease